MHKKIIFNIITFSLICVITFVSYAADINEVSNTISTDQSQNQDANENNKQNEEIKALQDQKTDVQNKAKESQENLELINTELSENMKQVQKMDETIAENQKNLDEVNKNISEIISSGKKIQKELNAVTKKYNEQKNLLDQRLVAMYEASETKYLDYILTSSNLSDFLSTYYLITELTEYDINLLETVEKEKKTIEDSKKQLEEKKSSLEEQRKIQVKTKIVLENSKLIRQNYIAKLSEEEKKVQAQIDEYNAQVEQLEKEILSLVATASFGENYTGGKMIWPIANHYNITSPFSMRVHPITKVYKLHTGIDISAPMGTDFLAVAHGMVVKAEYNRAYGNMVIVDHGGAVQTLYAHGSQIEVQVGQIVNAGDTVIKVGSTGYSTGPHAHFEIRVNGQPINPLEHISAPGQEKQAFTNQEENLSQEN